MAKIPARPIVPPAPIPPAPTKPAVQVATPPPPPPASAPKQHTFQKRATTEDAAIYGVVVQRIEKAGPVNTSLGSVDAIPGDWLVFRRDSMGGADKLALALYRDHDFRQLFHPVGRESTDLLNA